MSFPINNGPSNVNASSTQPLRGGGGGVLKGIQADVNIQHTRITDEFKKNQMATRNAELIAEKTTTTVELKRGPMDGTIRVQATTALRGPILKDK